MIPQAYVERVAIGLRRLGLAPPSWRLRCLRAALAVLRSCRLSEGTGVPVDNIQEEFGGEPVAAFSMSHPAVPALYIVLTLGLAMFSMQPVLIALSLAGGLAYGFVTRGAARTLGALRWQLPVILIIALVNPLFSASGSTELFRIGMRAVYLESMVYGLCMGGLFVASVLWFEAAASMLEYDKVLALLGNAAPVIALMISMCMRLIPQFLRRGRTVLAVQDAIDVPGRAPTDPVRSRLRASSVLMGWGMEDSLERADAMRSGGVPRHVVRRMRGIDWGAATLPRWSGSRCLVPPRWPWRRPRRRSIRFIRSSRCRRRGQAMSCTPPGWCCLARCTRLMRRGLADGSV